MSRKVFNFDLQGSKPSPFVILRVVFFKAGKVCFNAPLVLSEELGSFVIAIDHDFISKFKREYIRA